MSIHYHQALKYVLLCTLSSKFEISSPPYLCGTIVTPSLVVLNREVPFYKTSYPSLRVSLIDRFCHMHTQPNTLTHADKTYTHTHTHTHTHSCTILNMIITALNSVLSIFSSGHVDRILFWCVGMVNMSQSLSYGGELYSPHHVMYNSIQ